jgi:hypothetical protein
MIGARFLDFLFFSHHSSKIMSICPTLQKIMIKYATPTAPDLLKTIPNVDSQTLLYPRSLSIDNFFHVREKQSSAIRSTISSVSPKCYLAPQPHFQSTP